MKIVLCSLVICLIFFLTPFLSRKTFAQTNSSLSACSSWNYDFLPLYPNAKSYVPDVEMTGPNPFQAVPNSSRFQSICLLAAHTSDSWQNVFGWYQNFLEQKGFTYCPEKSGNVKDAPRGNVETLDRIFQKRTGNTYQIEIISYIFNDSAENGNTLDLTQEIATEPVCTSLSNNTVSIFNSNPTLTPSPSSSPTTTYQPRSNIILDNISTPPLVFSGRHLWIFDPNPITDWLFGLSDDVCVMITFCSPQATLDMRIVGSIDLLTLGGFHSLVNSWMENSPVFYDPNKTVWERAGAAIPVGINTALFVSTLGVGEGITSTMQRSGQAFIAANESRLSQLGINYTIVSNGGRVASAGSKVIEPGTKSLSQLYVQFGNTPALVAHEMTHIDQAASVIAKGGDSHIIETSLKQMESAAYANGIKAALKYEPPLHGLRDTVIQGFGWVSSKLGLISSMNGLNSIFH